MVGSRTVTALVGVAVSLLVSGLLFYYTGSLLFFLVVPFVPFLFTRESDIGSKGVSGSASAGGSTEADGSVERDGPAEKRCPRCEFRTRNPDFEYCPRDGIRLDEVSDGYDRW